MLKILLVAMAISTNAWAANEIYRCEIDGKKVFQNFPCNQKSPEVKEPKPPKYDEIVKCSMLDTFERLFIKNTNPKKCAP